MYDVGLRALRLFPAIIIIIILNDFRNVIELHYVRHYVSLCDGGMG
jgi:hypothetical protein